MATAAISQKSFNLGIKFAPGSDGEFSAYAAAFGNVDRAGEMIARGAFKNLDEFVKDGFICINHNWMNLPVATVDRAEQDQRGLKISGTFHSTPEAQACRTVIKERSARGKAVKLSIGYRVTDSAPVREMGRQYTLLKAITLMEASFVAVPANELAELIDVKDGRCNCASKQGRTLSAANHARLRAIRDGLREHADDLGAFLAEHGPSMAAESVAYTQGGKAIAHRRRWVALKARAALMGL